MRPAVRVVTSSLIAACLSCSSSPAALRGAPDGIWRGTGVYRGASLDFSIHFRSDGDTLRATFSSPDMMLLGQPLDSVRFDRPRVRFTTSDDHPVAFEGTVAGDSIVGTARIGVVPGVADSDAPPLRFTLRRTIVPPPPYGTHRVTFTSGSVELTGTVYLPPGMPHTLPGVVILQGSSSNLRHEYRFYADRFARAGFAVLAFDKRGKGESTGDYGAATYDEIGRASCRESGERSEVVTSVT